jgi:hypothetical protein
MLAVISSIIFFGVLIAQLFLSFRFYQLIKQLEDKKFYVSRRSRYAAVKDLNIITKTTNDVAVKNIADKIIKFVILARWLFLGCIILISLLFFINGIFKLNL